MRDKIYYAIGDVHGEDGKLEILHGRIKRRHAVDFPGRDICIVHLGDYVDRGPDSYAVIKRLMEMEQRATPGSVEHPDVINLKGNHEAMMFEACIDDDAASFWRRHGGTETLESYRYAGHTLPPKTHLDWINRLPCYYWDKTAKLIFVHAGIDVRRFPDDGEEKHLWSRSPRFLNSEEWPNALPGGTKVIHGHTPTDSGKPDVTAGNRRINLDTGACYGGDLTAAILAPGEPPQFIIA